jgi:hypothetical protein
LFNLDSRVEYPNAITNSFSLKKTGLKFVSRSSINGEKEKIVATVYILGAGTSKAVNPDAPLTNDLLPQALKLLETQHNEHAENIRCFIKDYHFYGREQLERDGELPGIEDIFSQLDYAIADNRPLSADYTTEKLRSIRESFVYAICEVLRQSLNDSSDLLNRFLLRIKDGDSIISLNYELMIDNALSRNLGKSVDYGIPMRHDDQTETQQAAANSLPLYKLHGSLNWLYCPRCQEITLTHSEKGVQYIFGNGADASRGTCPQCHSHYEPLIITPTMAKSYANPLLNEIWRKAEDKITTADEIIFAGYSLPSADVYLKCMLKRAVFANMQGYKRGKPRQELCPISIIDFDPDYNDEDRNDVHNRYVQLFGAVNYYPNGLEAFIGGKQ